MGNITNELKESYDVVIIGSGPAGALTAKGISNAGFNTVIIEKCSLPRGKVCTGILYPSAVKFISDSFGDMPEKVFCEPREIKGIRMYMTKDSESIELPFSKFDPGKDIPKLGVNVYRSEFDLWLCNQSDASLVGDCLFIDYSEDGDDIIVEVKHAGNRVKIKTKYLVGADGAQSKVRRSVSPEFDKPVAWIPCYEEWYEGTSNLEPGWLYFFCDRELTGFFNSVFHKDKAIEVTALAKQGESVKNYMQRFVEHLQVKHGLTIDKTVLKRGIMNNDMPGRKNYIFGKENALITGEASGILRGPEGITSSMIIGKVAGESILRSVASGKTAHECFTEHELLETEKAHCEQVINELEVALGYNIYTRE